jgi:outer membrane immunogenic protein
MGLIMRRFHCAALAAVAAIGFASFASAADLPVNALPPGPPGARVAYYGWTGFYIGGNLGGSWANNDATYFQPLFLGSGTASFSQASVIGGGQVGYNWQIGAMVLGAEADIEGRHWSDSATVAPFVGAPTALVNLTQEENWLGTVRGRIGFTYGNALLYATGGVAFGGTQHSYTEFVSTNAAQTRTLSDSTTKTGWTAGAGVEYAMWKNVPGKVSLGIEYLYVDLGDTTLSQGASTVGGLPFSPSQATFKDRSNIVRAKLNWRFSDWAGR